MTGAAGGWRCAWAPWVAAPTRAEAERIAPAPGACQAEKIRGGLAAATSAISKAMPTTTAPTATAPTPAPRAPGADPHLALARAIIAAARLARMAKGLG